MKNEKMSYISFPYYDPAMEFMKDVIKKSRIDDVLLAPTITSSNRNAIFANMKDKDDVGYIKHAKFRVKCKDCEFYACVYTGLYDVARTIELEMVNRNSGLHMHCVKTGHSMENDVDRMDIERFRNERDLSVAKRLRI